MKLESSEMLYLLSSPAVEEADGGSKCFVGVSVKVRSLVDPG